MLLWLICFKDSVDGMVVCWLLLVVKFYLLVFDGVVGFVGRWLFNALCVVLMFFGYWLMVGRLLLILVNWFIGVLF